MCNLRKNPQIGPKGTPKIDPVLDPLYFKSLHTCTGFKAIFETLLDMEREGR
jgi:hypothetical protein